MRPINSLVDIILLAGLWSGGDGGSGGAVGAQRL